MVSAEHNSNTACAHVLEKCVLKTSRVLIAHVIYVEPDCSSIVSIWWSMRLSRCARKASSCFSSSRTTNICRTIRWPSAVPSSSSTRCRLRPSSVSLSQNSTSPGAPPLDVFIGVTSSAEPCPRETVVVTTAFLVTSPLRFMTGSSCSSATDDGWAASSAVVVVLGVTVFFKSLPRRRREMQLRTTFCWCSVVSLLPADDDPAAAAAAAAASDFHFNSRFTSSVFLRTLCSHSDNEPTANDRSINQSPINQSVTFRGLCIRRKVSFESRNVTEGRFGEGVRHGWNASPTSGGRD